MKKSFSIILLCTIALSFFSCSLTFEKRRYRPGYHVEVLKMRNNNPVFRKKDELNTVNQAELNPVKMPTYHGIISHTKVSTVSKKTKVVANLKVDEKKSHSSYLPLITYSSKHKLELRKNFVDPKNVNAKSKVGLILGLIFGAIALAFLIVGLVIISGGGWGGLNGFIYLIISLIVLIFALVFGFIKWKTKEDYSPVTPKFINSGFIMSIIAAGAGLLAFMFSFFIFPFGWITIGFVTAAFALGIIGFSFGFRALMHDKSLKTKMMIILGFIALLMVMLALIVLFV